MATIDRFKECLKTGKLPKELGGKALDAQTKYDFLAAVHTMDQIEALAENLKARAKKREALKQKLVESTRSTLQGMLDDEDGLNTAKKLEDAMKVLEACCIELSKLEGADHDAKAVGKMIQDGVSAGR